ncbi:hypothetical protein BH23GEM9_BH23GEM9_29180 [soil metagenome]
MANFLLVVDPDPQRRTRFLERVKPRLAPVDGLVVSGLSTGSFAALWAAQARAPVSTGIYGEGVAMVWGDALAGPGPERLDAAGLARLWAGDDVATTFHPRPFDGFHAVAYYHPANGLTVGADVLGLFPLYYAAGREVLVVGSSPELFRYHDLFPAELSPRGLAGQLLTHTPFAGETLLRGVRRLQPGCALHRGPEGGCREVPQYVIPASRAYETLSFTEHIEIIDATFAEAVRRHTPPGDAPGLLLSGGRDSRLLGGYLHRQGHTPRALTLGMKSDYEVQCALPVATALGLEHRVASLEYADFPRAATLQARWEHLATGFSSIHMWGAIEPLRWLPPHFFAGYLREVREIPEMPVPFEQHFGKSSRRAIAPQTLRGLLRREVFGEVVDETLARIQAAYESCSPVAAQRPWRYLLANDWRFHAGGVPWKLTFGSWPVLPVLDRRVLEVIAALPDSSLANRRAQDEIFRTRFPSLARIPLDRNNHDTSPLLSSRTRRAAAPLLRRLHRLREQGLTVGRGGERRYYHRMYDFNSPGWRAVRRLAEPHRERLADLFQMDALGLYVPPPEKTVALEHAVLDGFGRKLLIGLMLWSGEHLG